jgi:hypothetical protein
LEERDETSMLRNNKQYLDYALKVTFLRYGDEPGWAFALHSRKSGCDTLAKMAVFRPK